MTGLFKLSAWIANILILSLFLTLILNPENTYISKYLMTMIIIFEWMHSLMFGQAIQSTGRLVLTISKILIHDLSRFSFIYIILLTSFSAALTLLQSNGNDSTITQIGWRKSMFVMYEISLGMGGFFSNLINDPTDLVVAQFIYVIFLLLSVVMLFNLLIAIMVIQFTN